ncbi:syntaxin-61, putative [Entamoeba invadens IP1]|uniref:syntaxin-61, putative n=1 Tax=Entamoeba invadens IP1 TaxID=370355 RepID=UPI0002C3D434|nr:syntaxin-61, putative [Entamoeba invadens IP1]ELP85263.1 syntaxin-61, putative [Entamoeba invadens IP1]|eukprot:XP_004184609.1 syntaxin-61, putative [Entamoeba invadens IP1]
MATTIPPQRQNKQTMNTSQETELNDYMREENDFFIDNERNRQQQIIKKQDAQLDKLHENVKTVHEIGMTINDEISQQDQMLNEMSNQVDTTDQRIVSTKEKIDKVIEKSSNWKIGLVVGGLILVLVILLILIFVL